MHGHEFLLRNAVIISWTWHFLKNVELPTTRPKRITQSASLSCFRKIATCPSNSVPLKSAKISTNFFPVKPTMCSFLLKILKLWYMLCNINKWLGFLCFFQNFWKIPVSPIYLGGTTLHHNLLAWLQGLHPQPRAPGTPNAPAKWVKGWKRWKGIRGTFLEKVSQIFADNTSRFGGKNPFCKDLPTSTMSPHIGDIINL